MTADRTAVLAEIQAWAREHRLPYFDERVHFPDLRIEYEDRERYLEREDIEVVTGDYRGAHAAVAARSGFARYRGVGGLVGGRGGGGERRRRAAWRRGVAMSLAPAAEPLAD